MMVAAETDRDLIYFTFHENKTMTRLNKIVEIIKRQNLNVSQIYNLIGEYKTEISHLSSSDLEKFNFCRFLITKFQ